MSQEILQLFPSPILHINCFSTIPFLRNRGIFCNFADSVYHLRYLKMRISYIYGNTATVLQWISHHQNRHFVLCVLISLSWAMCCEMAGVTLPSVLVRILKNAQQQLAAVMSRYAAVTVEKALRVLCVTLWMLLCDTSRLSWCFMTLYVPSIIWFRVKTGRHSKNSAKRFNDEAATRDCFQFFLLKISTWFNFQFSNYWSSDVVFNMLTSYQWGGSGALMGEGAPTVCAFVRRIVFKRRGGGCSHKD